jgi:predicted  nucleic acid-binding Zn-ribbon protein
MDTGRKNNDIFKRRMEASSQEKTELTQSLATLQERFETLQSERDQLQARTEGGPTPDVVAALTAQVDELIRDKNALEKSLTEATAVNAVAAPSAEVERELVSVYSAPPI